MAKHIVSGGMGDKNDACQGTSYIVIVYCFSYLSLVLVSYEGLSLLVACRHVAEIISIDKTESEGVRGNVGGLIFVRCVRDEVLAACWDFIWQLSALMIQSQNLFETCLLINKG